MSNDEWTILVKQPHALERDEAKRRIDEKIAEVLGNKSLWAAEGSWDNYTYTFALNGTGAGTRGEVKVWSERVTLKIFLPDNLMQWKDLVEKKAPEKLSNTLA